ncbi:MAG: CDP-alcohol phosphatidyltransferase family protein [Bacteroidota bacterium]
MTIEQIKKWNERHAKLMFGLSILAVITKRIELLSLGALLSFSSYVHQGSNELKKMSPAGGYANLTTGLRLLLVVIGSFLFTYVSKEWILAIMTTAVLLDIVDGYLAKKFNQVTTFGQFFDMEVDAFFVILMCFYYYQYQEVGWWILVPGIMRYAFKLFTVLVSKEGFVESKKRYAAMIAGIFFTILLACILVDIPYALLMGSVAIVLSFSVSIIEYLKY